MSRTFILHIIHLLHDAGDVVPRLGVPPVAALELLLGTHGADGASQAGAAGQVVPQLPENLPQTSDSVRGDVRPGQSGYTSVRTQRVDQQTALEREVVIIGAEAADSRYDCLPVKLHMIKCEA